MKRTAILFFVFLLPMSSSTFTPEIVYLEASKDPIRIKPAHSWTQDAPNSEHEDKCIFNNYDCPEQLVRVPHITLQEFVSATRTTIDELNKDIDRMIEEDGIAAARRELFWKVNVLTVIYKERETGQPFSKEQVIQHAADNGLLIE